MEERVDRANKEEEEDSILGNEGGVNILDSIIGRLLPLERMHRGEAIVPTPLKLEDVHSPLLYKNSEFR